jgi:multidrug transporter EmrE-like cation transporter
MSWIIDILIASIFVTGSYLAVKYASIKSKNDTGLIERCFIIISLTMGLLAMLVLIFFRETRNNVINDFKKIENTKWIILSGLLIFISYFFLFRGSVNSPNLGYARSILTIDIIMLTVCSAILFGSPISFSSIIGMLFIISGIILVSVYN